MQILRRDFLQFASFVSALPVLTNAAAGQPAATGPKLTQILRRDLEAQGHVVQETLVNFVEFGPGSAAPWHLHPGAQELLYVVAGSLILEIEGGGSSLLRAGEAGIVPAEVVHLARNNSTSARAGALVVHSRAAKDKPLAVTVTR